MPFQVSALGEDPLAVPEGTVQKTVVGSDGQIYLETTT